MTSADAGATFETIEAQLLLAEKLAAEPSELEAQPFWLQRPSATLKLLRLLASHHALPSPISAAFEGMISLQQWLASRRWPLDSIDAAATMLADTVGDATAGSALRRQLLLAHATQLPLASEADVATADSAWLHEWRLLLAVLAGCLPVDMAAFASVTLSGTAGVRMQPRPVRAKMLQTLEAVLKTKSSSEPGFAEAKAQLDQLKEELQQLEADACAQALEAVGGKWTSLYSTARGQSDQLEALAIELLASMGAASGTSLSSGATWRAARMVAGQGGASSWSDVVATVASTAAARLLGSKAEAAAGELTSNRGTPRLRTAAAQSTSILSDEDCIRALEAFLMQAAAAAAAEPTDETNAAVKTGLTQLLSDFAAVGERHCVCWSKTALALLRLGQAWQADVGSALAAAVRLEALRQIWSESGDDVAALDQHLAGSEHTFAALWQAACGAVSQADDVASLLSRWQQWRERLQDATEELGRTALLDACAATALRRALELDADGALAALCCNALALGVGPEMLLAVAAEAEAKGRPAWVRAALLLAGRTDGRWTEALKSDAVVPDSLGLAALTYLVCQQKQLGALGASTPAVLALVLDACVEIEGGVNMALAPTGLRLKLEPEEICAQLDAVTAGSWLLRVRGTGRGQRTLGAAVAAAAGLKSGR